MKSSEVDPAKVEAFIDNQIEERKKFVFQIREKFYDEVSKGTEQGDVLAAAALDRMVAELNVINYLGEEQYMVKIARKLEQELAKAAGDAPQA